jgi:hypothetical protein
MPEALEIYRTRAEAATRSSAVLIYPKGDAAPRLSQSLVAVRVAPQFASGCRPITLKNVTGMARIFEKIFLGPLFFVSCPACPLILSPN